MSEMSKYIRCIYVFEVKKLVFVLCRATVEYRQKIIKFISDECKKTMNIIWSLFFSFIVHPRKNKCPQVPPLPRSFGRMCLRREPTRPLWRPAECRPVQMPFTQKRDTPASHAAVPKGRLRPVFRTHLRSRLRLIISTCSGPPVNYNYYRGVQQFFVLKIAIQTTCLLL